MSSPADAPAPGRATRLDALRAALRALGIAADVDAEGTLAVLRPAVPLWGLGTVLRNEIVRLARESGFTHVALELPTDTTDDAHVHRDQPRA